MNPFANRLTIKISTIAAIISFIITSFQSFNTISSFHGNIIEFLFYFIEGLSGAIFNGAVSFCICGILIILPVKFLENRMRWYYLEKEEKKQAAKEAKRKAMEKS